MTAVRSRSLEPSQDEAGRIGFIHPTTVLLEFEGVMLEEFLHHLVKVVHMQTAKSTRKGRLLKLS